MPRRRKATAVGIALFAVGVGIGATGSTFSAFSNTTSSATNSFSSAADWTGPTVSAKAIGKSTGGTPAGGKPGAVKTNGTFYAYANVTDTGNPAAGMSTGTVTVDLTNVNGQAGVTLSSTGGPWTVDGTTYNYRSAQLTATKAPGTFNVPLTASDGASNSTSTTIPVTIDNTAPTASDIQTVNKTGGTAARAEQGDQIVFTFSEQIDPYSVIPSTSWNGTTAANVVVHLDNGNTSDTVTIFNAANSAALNLGTITLGGKNYTTSNITFGGTGTASTMVQNGTTVTVTLGTQSAAATTATAATAMTWTPLASVLDIAGNAMSTVAKGETGASDVDF